MAPFETMPKMFQRVTRKGCLPLVALAVFLPFAALLLLYVQARLLPSDAPLARMYRAESTLAALARAVESYHEQYGTYPTPGTDGLRAAIHALSRVASYFGGDLPPDPWDRPYHYVPNSHYAEPDSDALSKDGSFFAPDSFQIYSAGADGLTGKDNPDAMRDNITCWDTSRPWRSVYRVLTREFFEQQRKR